jgi:glutathione S-transferase
LAGALGDKPYLDGDRFTAGDLMMAAVLRVLDHTDLLAEHPNLVAFKQHCESRLAFVRALNAQLADFSEQPQAAE